MEDCLFGGVVDDWNCVLENWRFNLLVLADIWENRYCEFGCLA